MPPVSLCQDVLLSLHSSLLTVDLFASFSGTQTMAYWKSFTLNKHRCRDVSYTMPQYLKRFKAAIEVVPQCRWWICGHASVPDVLWGVSVIVGPLRHCHSYQPAAIVVWEQLNEPFWTPHSVPRAISGRGGVLKPSFNHFPPSTAKLSLLIENNAVAFTIQMWVTLYCWGNLFLSPFFPLFCLLLPDGAMAMAIANLQSDSYSGNYNSHSLRHL